ncbi:MAG: sodium:proton antiporter [Paludibacteraceae bacterium]|nr:sodium:proton antiporter [Paludibacteraceae bacterium]
MEHLIPAWMLIPFVVMLLCIAVLPLVPKVGEWWEENLHKLFVSLLLGTPVAVWMCLNGMSHDITHQMVYDYMPFILLLMSLFVTTGGICIRADLRATPLTNTLIMALGWVLASFMGTTGAAMLLIRLLLETIQQRKYKVHTVAFFIAIVANCGGLLTPLGDPPLFLLFQKGAPFGWFMSMIPEWAVTGGLLLLIYFLLDTWYYRREPLANLMADVREHKPLQLSGLINIFWLLCVIASTMFINKTYIPAMGAEDAPFYLKLLREWAFILIILGSIVTTKKDVRLANNFSWTPILEVACVFLGIFATMTPALMFLQQNPLPVNKPWEFVYCTGALSAFLDNAPTAMVFHATATTLPAAEGAVMVAGIQEIFLKAICMGAVFFGSLTYIGNGPNFMVKSIAEQDGIKMPSFFGYMFKYSLVIFLPVYIIVQLLFI